MTDEAHAHVLAFYDRHPISAAEVLTRIKDQRGSLDRLKPEDVFPHDQDHYGGLAANDELAMAAAIRSDDLVLDLCCGLGGPARYQALSRRCRVVGLDYNEGRIKGAADLTRRVNLARRVRFVRGDAETLPFPPETFDAVLSQEALLHLPDKGKALAEAFRVLKPGGRFAVSDVVVRGEIPAEIRRNVELWIGCLSGALDEADYVARLTRAGFEDVSIDPTRVYKVDDAREFLSGHGFDVDTLAPMVDGRFFSGFIRARKPAAATRPA